MTDLAMHLEAAPAPLTGKGGKEDTGFRVCVPSRQNAGQTRRYLGASRYERTFFDVKGAFFSAVPRLRVKSTM
jgi:hypothetical protein